MTSTYFENFCPTPPSLSAKYFLFVLKFGAFLDPRTPFMQTSYMEVPLHHHRLLHGWTVAKHKTGGKCQTSHDLKLKAFLIPSPLTIVTLGLKAIKMRPAKCMVRGNKLERTCGK